MICTTSTDLPTPVVHHAPTATGGLSCTNCATAPVVPHAPTAPRHYWSHMHQLPHMTNAPQAPTSPQHHWTHMHQLPSAPVAPHAPTSPQHQWPFMHQVPHSTSGPTCTIGSTCTNCISGPTCTIFPHSTTGPICSKQLLRWYQLTLSTNYVHVLYYYPYS